MAENQRFSGFPKTLNNYSLLSLIYYPFSLSSLHSLSVASKRNTFRFCLVPGFFFVFYSFLPGTRQKAQCESFLAVREIGSSLSSLGFFADGRVKSQIVFASWLLINRFSLWRKPSTLLHFSLLLIPSYQPFGKKLYAHLPSLLRNSALLSNTASFRKKIML